jgi:hypothetical protein
MAITAAAGANRIVRGGPGKTIFEDGKSVAGSATIPQGVLVCFDTTAHALKQVAATGDAATLVGISDVAIKSGSLVGPYDGLTAVDAAQAAVGFVGPKCGVTAALTLKTGDAFNPGAKVFLADAADSATVSVTDPGDANHVGIYVGPAVASAAAGQTGPVLVGCRYPAGTGAALQF